MNPTFLLFLLLISPLHAQSASHITVTGSVFCDVCYDNSFTKHSYFLPGVDVHLQCKFQANAPKTKTSEQIITFSVNTTTNRYGVYMLDIPSVEGVDCVDGPILESFCETTLIGSPLPTCDVPAVSTSSKEITVKSRSTNLCVYSVSALTYKPSSRNSTLCGAHHINLEEEEKNSLDSSKFFLPYFPWPQFPPWPSLPPFPSLPPLPPFPSFPPFHFPPQSPLPPLPQLPPLPPLPPVLNPGAPPPPVNPTAWIPFPIQSAPPPPPPPGVNLRDPRTWFPPSPDSQQQQP